LFIEHIQRMRTWMKNHGQQDKPLIISEYGVLQPLYEGFTSDRINDYMMATFNYLLFAKDPTLGYPADENRLVQRWAWFSLNTPMGSNGGDGGWNGNLFDPATHQITSMGLNYAHIACSQTQPTPTPSTTPRSSFTVREAEDGSLDADITPVAGQVGIGESASASGCRYVDQGVTFSVYVPSTGDYVIWGRTQGVDLSNKVFDVVATGQSAVWYVPIGSNWSWSRVSNYSPAVDPVVFHLEGGRWHTIHFGARGRPRLDMVVITTDRAYSPQNPGSSPIQICNPTPTATATITPTPSRTPTPTFSVTPTITRTPMPSGAGKIQGHVVFQGRGTPPASTWQNPLVVSAHLPGDPIPAYQFDVTSDQQGQFNVPTGLLPGTYDVGVRDTHSLRNLRSNVGVSANTPDLDMGTLLEGDTNLDNRINILDFSILASTYGNLAGSPGYDARADFNSDDRVNILDFSLLAANYGQQGDRILASQPAGAVSLQASSPRPLGTVRVSVQPSPKSVTVGQSFTLDVYMDTLGNPVTGIDCLMAFDTTYLNVQTITPGSILSPIPGQLWISGNHINYSAGIPLGNPPVSGSFKLFTLTIQAKLVAGSTPLTYASVVIAGLAGQPHTGDLRTGTVVIALAPTPTNTLNVTRVPSPTATNTPGSGALEIVLRQGVNGYTGFEDTYIDAFTGNERRNYSREDFLWVGPPNTSTYAKGILIRANLSMLPPGTVIEDATLTLYQTSGSSNRITGKGYGVLHDWVVSQTTWISATQSIPWSTVGCGAPGTDRATDPSTQRMIFPTWGEPTRYPFDFTGLRDLVQQWVNNPDANEGLVILSDDDTSATFKFGSSENAVESSRPRLTIRYRLGPTPTPTATSTETATPTSMPTVTSTDTPGPSPSPTHTSTSTPTNTPVVTETPTGTPTFTPTPTYTPTSTPLVKGIIAGWVFEDLNGNGEFDSGEPGVANATVELRNAANVLLANRSSAPDGSYTFDQLDPATYRVRLGQIPAGYVDPAPATYVVYVNYGDHLTLNFALRRTAVSHDVALPLILNDVSQ
jgi:hypothetical protein